MQSSCAPRRVLRLFLPESWTSDLARLKRAGVPLEYRTARTKPEIALAEIDRLTAAGVRFGCVLADAGYGLSAPFRQGLTARNLTWAVGKTVSWRTGTKGKLKARSAAVRVALAIYRCRPKTCWPMPSGIPRHLKVYPVDVRLIWPVAKRGRPRRRHVPDIPRRHVVGADQSIRNTSGACYYQDGFLRKQLISMS
jgi:DDE superfamily endonuclease